MLSLFIFRRKLLFFIFIEILKTFKFKFLSILFSNYIQLKLNKNLDFYYYYCFFFFLIKLTFIIIFFIIIIIIIIL